MNGREPREKGRRVEASRGFRRETCAVFAAHFAAKIPSSVRIEAVSSLQLFLITVLKSNNFKGGISMTNNNTANNANGNKIQQFHSDEFGSLDILLIDGKPYFPATECAEKLGYKNPRKAIIDHCRCVTKRDTPHPQNPEKSMERSFIPEGDLYRLIIRSKLPAAQRFEVWVMDTVLPSIRKFGAYIAPETLEEMVTSPEFAIALLTQLQKEREKNAELAPKAQYYDKILQCKNAVPVSLIAKDYGMAAARFNALLHDLRVQYKIGGAWLLYQDYAGKGYTQTRTYHFGETSAAIHTCWTQAGRLFLYDFLAEYGILPTAELLAGLFDDEDLNDEGDYEYYAAEDDGYDGGVTV
jgi:prophage antirepressor-like protein